MDCFEPRSTRGAAPASQGLVLGLCHSVSSVDNWGLQLCLILGGAPFFSPWTAREPREISFSKVLNCASWNISTSFLSAENRYFTFCSVHCLFFNELEILSSYFLLFSKPVLQTRGCLTCFLHPGDANKIVSIAPETIRIVSGSLEEHVPLLWECFLVQRWDLGAKSATYSLSKRQKSATPGGALAGN